MGRDLVDEVLDDHQELYGLFHELVHTEGEQRAVLFRYLLARLAAHEAAEAALVHRTVRDRVPGGAALADAAAHEEAAIEQRMAVLADFDVDTAEFAQQLQCLYQHVLRHTGYEECEEFTRLREHLDATTLEELGARFARARHDGPIRPRAATPASPGIREVTGPTVTIWPKAQRAVHDTVSS